MKLSNVNVFQCLKRRKDEQRANDEKNHQKH